MTCPCGCNKAIKVGRGYELLIIEDMAGLSSILSKFIS